MLKVWDGTQWWPNSAPVLGQASGTITLKSGDIHSYITPTGAGGISTISNTTSKTLVVNVYEHVPTTDAGRGYNAMTGTNTPIGVTLTDAMTDFSYRLTNATRGTTYNYADSLFDTGNPRALTEGGLASNTSYSYNWYVGNLAYPYYDWVNNKVATTKVDLVTVTKPYYAKWSRSHSDVDTNGRTDYPTRLYHDRIDSTHGRQVGMFGFNIYQLDPIPADATINSVKLYLRSQHWYNGSGGSCGIHLANHSATTGFTSSIDIDWLYANDLYATRTPNYSDRDYPLTFTLSNTIGNYLRGTGGNRYFWVGSTSTQADYGYFYGYGSSYPPKLEITYTYEP